MAVGPRIFAWVGFGRVKCTIDKRYPAHRFPIRPRASATEPMTGGAWRWGGRALGARVGIVTGPSEAEQRVCCCCKKCAAAECPRALPPPPFLHTTSPPRQRPYTLPARCLVICNRGHTRRQHHHQKASSSTTHPSARKSSGALANLAHTTHTTTTFPSTSRWSCSRSIARGEASRGRDRKV